MTEKSAGVRADESTARWQYIWRHGILQFGVPSQLVGVTLLYHLTWGGGWDMFLSLRFRMFFVVLMLFVAVLGGIAWGSIMWIMIGRSEYLRKHDEIVQQ